MLTLRQWSVILHFLVSTFTYYYNPSLLRLLHIPAVCKIRRASRCFPSNPALSISQIVLAAFFLVKPHTLPGELPSSVCFGRCKAFHVLGFLTCGAPNHVCLVIPCLFYLLQEGRRDYSARNTYIWISCAGRAAICGAHEAVGTRRDKINNSRSSPL